MISICVVRLTICLLVISFQGSPLGLVRLVRNFTKKKEESDEQARRRFFRRIFGILWVSSIGDFNSSASLTFPSSVWKSKYHSLFNVSFFRMRAYP